MRQVNGVSVIAGYATDEAGLTSLYAIRMDARYQTSLLFRAPLAGTANRAGAVRTAAPALTQTSTGRLLLAAIDGTGALVATLIDATLPTTGAQMRSLARNADMRFSPAIGEVNAHLIVAYTDGSATPMRMMTVTTDIALSGATSRDISPAGMGGASPTWIDGAQSPTLIFVDAHGGLSPLLTATWTAEGTMSPVQVERALSTIAEPAAIASGQFGADRYVAYVAIGRAATSAVGLVKLGASDPPIAIIPGVGYGASHVSAASTRTGIVFVADAPPTAETAGARQFVARVLDEAGLGQPLTIPSPEPGPNFASIARAEGDSFDVAFSTSAAVYLARIRCHLPP
ncbi:MAG: hypothetical protein IPK60_14590 [Sandaracinaceae bacterium]|nr:hypothetical protein [Sandaracinaceae bacterium]